MLGLRVPAQVDLALKGPRAGPAGEWLEARVLATVRNEIGGLTECFATLTADVGLLACEQ